MGVSDEHERREHLARRGNNVFRLAASVVPHDCFSDVPHTVMVPAAARGVPEADPDEVAAALAPLTGDASVTFAIKGRAAEIALVEALELAPASIVLTHGLFSTTQTALARAGATVETLAVRGEGSADLDVDALAARLARGDVRVVYLETAANALGGWPLSEAHLAEVRAHCDRHGARLLLDATRVLANSVALEASDVVAAARRTLALAHAFTISCAKEFGVPHGAVVGSPDATLVGRATQLAFKYGTSLSPIDPPAPRAELRDGFRFTLAQPAILGERLARVRALGAKLEARGVPVLRPITAHAVFVPIDPALAPAGNVAAMLSLFGHLYVVSGVRAQLAHGRRGPAIRLALKVHDAIAEPALDAIADGIATLFARLDERPALRIPDGQDAAHPFFRRAVPA